jgi:hypothetical protein
MPSPTSTTRPTSDTSSSRGILLDLTLDDARDLVGLDLHVSLRWVGDARKDARLFKMQPDNRTNPDRIGPAKAHRGGVKVSGVRQRFLVPALAPMPELMPQMARTLLAPAPFGCRGQVQLRGIDLVLQLSPPPRHEPVFRSVLFLSPSCSSLLYPSASSAASAFNRISFPFLSSPRPAALLRFLCVPLSSECRITYAECRGSPSRPSSSLFSCHFSLLGVPSVLRCLRGEGRARFASATGPKRSSAFLSPPRPLRPLR